MSFSARHIDEGPQSPLQRKAERRGADSLDGLAVPREERRRSNARHADRHYLADATYAVTYRGRSHEVQVVNLSGGGAMIAAPLKPMLNEHLELLLGEGASVECVVRWVKEGRIGLEFAHETQLHCSDEEQAELLRAAIRHAFPGQNIKNPRERAPASDKRNAARHPLIWGGELIYGPSSWTARLRNVSSTGALVECPGTVREGCEIVLDLRGAGSVTATVSWVVGNYLGLSFDEPFDMRRLAQSKPSVAPPKWMRPSYLEDHVPADSAWDESWRRMSVDQLREHLEGYMKR
jgi:PilZ domain-containing protein